MDTVLIKMSCLDWGYGNEKAVGGHNDQLPSVMPDKSAIPEY